MHEIILKRVNYLRSAATTLAMIAGGLMMALSSPALAAIVGGAVTGGSAQSAGGTFQLLTSPFTESVPDNTVGEDNFQSNNLFGFNEDQNILIDAPLAVDVGTQPESGDIVASHYLIFDPVQAAVQGFVDFDADIFGVATSTSTLADSDFLANTGVTYLNPGNRGLEAGDLVAIDLENPRRLIVDLSASSPGDYVRVLTMESPLQVIPLPAALPLFATALLGLGAAGWSRRSRG